MNQSTGVTPVPRPLVPLWAAIVLALASGPILDAGFPDKNWWPMTFLGIAVVLVSLIGRRPRSALLVGFIAGMAFYLVHIEWASLFLGPVPMTALSFLESLFVALGAMLMSLVYRWSPRAWPSARARLWRVPITIAGIWTAREAIESLWPYGGFAWGRVALSQSESPFNNLFAWLGVSGVSFVMVLLVALALEAVRSAPIARLTRVTVSVAALTVVLVVPAFPIALSGTSSIAAVQGNGKAAYFDTRQQGDLLAAQFSATVPLFGKKVDMVVWPEGASDIDPLENESAARVFDLVSEQMHAPLIAGAITQRGDKIYNTSLLWEAGKSAVDYYDKKHPVPFGEYVPDRAFWEPLAPDLIGLIGRDYTPGTTDTVFDVNGIIAGIDICFDISDDAVMSDSVRSGAQILLAQTNNADFGHTDESVQQLAIARIRALELGRSVVNISTVGTSAMIAPDGSTIRQLKSYTADSMVADVPLSSTLTPASQFAALFEKFAGALGLLGLFALWLTGRGPRVPKTAKLPRRSR
ncbi:apolipoprotein N-acyltransferase [Glaciihabitans sp. dw_435]|uniref:apolipoprotein N-acyltransferase n=1 Tax=Glaciihabitans sp. dw_435 TaxID=2720081 RepID=UPI001BD2AA84|nr:apolipoprotein N-acyltransferase [Glaciihabitans sp. dw_435]